ncbi:arylsulfatase, partial [Thozetella sp. PMI_491]
MGSLEAADCAASSKKQNFLIIVADDLGFSDCGCFGSEISTPHIDNLAKDGLRFTSFHVAAACSPTRAMLMSGTDHHLTGLGQLSEFVRMSPAHQGAPGHEGYLVDSVAALPELLQDGGYHTMMAGKWHLGLKKQHGPAARGFDRSFALLPGCANHYGYEPQYEDPIHEPHPFFETAVTALHSENGQYVSELPANFYSSDFYASKLIEYLDERSGSNKEKPFFAYLPFSAPHWPLQAPKEAVDKYKGVYSDGPSALRLQRLEALKKMGLIGQDVNPHEMVVSAGEPDDWPVLTPLEREKSARSMEVFAGMVEQMDLNIGRVIDHLKNIGEYDNTLIIFMSDNGAEGASYEAIPLVGTDIMSHIEKYYDNSLENIGRHDSFVWYGARWAQAATAPSRLYKMFSTQGGCRVPLVLKPATATQSFSAAGSITDAFCTVMDIVPTILELAGIPHPGTEFRGKPVEQLRGLSWTKFLDSVARGGRINDLEFHRPDQVTGWEVAGSGAIRKGRYKITFVPAPKGPQRWELFDIAADPGETRDIGGQEPEILREMLLLWEQYKKDVGVVGLAGEFSLDGVPKDEFEDVGKWIRFMGRKNL